MNINIAHSIATNTSMIDWRCGHTDAFKLGFVGFFFLLDLRDFTGI